MQSRRILAYQGLTTNPTTGRTQKSQDRKNHVNRMLLAMAPVIALAAFVGGRTSAPPPDVFDQSGVGSDGKLFGVIRAGSLLTDRNTGWELRGDVTAGSDVVVYLKDGHTVMRPLAVALDPCGWPSDFDPDMVYVLCHGMLETSGRSVLVSGATIYGR